VKHTKINLSVKEIGFSILALYKQNIQTSNINKNVLNSNDDYSSIISNSLIIPSTSINETGFVFSLAIATDDVLASLGEDLILHSNSSKEPI